MVSLARKNLMHDWLRSAITVAGNGSPGWAGDNGRAALAQLNAPAALTFDTRGNLYIADTFNHIIRKVTPEGIITTAAGTSAGFAARLRRTRVNASALPSNANTLARPNSARGWAGMRRSTLS